jgi:hypothetical protein
MSQLPLPLTLRRKSPNRHGPVSFDGRTFDPALDEERLKNLLGRVWNFMQGGGWHTLAEIQSKCGGTEASVSARLRDLRKERFGSYTIKRRRVSGGLWEYRMEARWSTQPES